MTLDLQFAALANPTRRAIVMRLRKGEASVNELVARFDLTQPTISSHLKVLEEAKLISRSREGQSRPCRLRPEGLKAIDDWIGLYRDLWTTRFDKLDARLERLRKSGK